MATTTECAATPGLYRLLAWLSPSFPIGGFSYSHGLETAVADGTVTDRASLEAWIFAIVVRGSGRIDADILVAAHRAPGEAALAAANEIGLAYRATAELALESAQQGTAFLAACRSAWGRGSPHPNPPPRAGEGADGAGKNPTPRAGEGREGAAAGHAAAFGAAAAEAAIPLEHALLGYLQAFAANLMSAGIRLGVIGQTDGQRILAALEPAITAAAAAALVRDPEDFGSATFAADLASMAHENQYTRLFRS